MKTKNSQNFLSILYRLLKFLINNSKIVNPINLFCFSFILFFIFIFTNKYIYKMFLFVVIWTVITSNFIFFLATFTVYHRSFIQFSNLIFMFFRVYVCWVAQQKKRICRIFACGEQRCDISFFGLPQCVCVCFCFVISIKIKFATPIWWLST